jgi:hypothetical protein
MKFFIRIDIATHRPVMANCGRPAVLKNNAQNVAMRRLTFKPA